MRCFYRVLLIFLSLMYCVSFAAGQDVVDPEVSISVPTGVQNDAFDATITFTEVVSGFEQSDVSVSGTATASITAFSTDDNTVFTATLTPTMSGEVVLSIAAGVATDAANNNNTASETHTVTVVYIPDRNLKAVLRDALKLKNDAPITAEALQGLTELDAESRSIGNLTGLEHATGLETLSLDKNRALSDLTPLRQLTQLTELSFYYCMSVSNIEPLENLTQLTKLDLMLTVVDDIEPLSKLTQLTELEFSRYFPSSVSFDLTPLANLTALTKLQFSGGACSNLTPLSSLTELTELNLYRNNISVLTPLSSLTQLTKLNLHRNEVSDLIPLSDLTQLTELNLHLNKVSDLIPLSDLTQLTWLNLWYNKISDLTPLSTLTQLITLGLLKNEITDVNPLSTLENLQYLTLIWNPLLDTSPLWDLLSENDGTITSIDISVSQYAPWDVNQDGSVDASDSALVTAALGQSGGGILNSRTDVNGDGTVDNDDLTLVTDNLDAGDNAPAIGGMFTVLDPATLEKLDPTTLEAQLDVLRAKSDGSLKYQRAIALLESMLSALRPAETLLLANYPNPFNPETWIPYELSEPNEVRIRIYDVRGRVVRDLQLGHQPAGYYTSRSRAAYWDGKNNVGERVASGIYFYQLQADHTSLLRKMVILQ